MTSEFVRASRRFLTLALLVTVPAGCTTTKTVYSPMPKHTSSATSAAELISQAASDECTQYNKINNSIAAATKNATVVANLILLMQAQGRAWARSFSNAAKIANRPGVPAGHNVARILAVDLDRIALDLDNIQVAMAVGRFDKVTGTWNQTLRDLSAMRTQCSA